MSKCCLLLFLACSFVVSQTSPYHGLRDKTPHVIALTNATITVNPQQTIQGNLLIRNGLIEKVGENITIPEDAMVVDATNLHIYPGFIDPFSSYGIKTTQAQQSGDWRGSPNVKVETSGAQYWNTAVHPEYDTASAFEVDKKQAQQMKSQGFTCVQVANLDGVFRGKSLVVSLATETTNDVIVKKGHCQFMSFRKGSSKQPYPGSLMGSIALIRQVFYDVRWYHQAQQAYLLNKKQSKPETNQALQSLKPVMFGIETVIFATSNEQDLLRAAKIAEEFQLQFIYKGSGYEYRQPQAIAALKSKLIIPVNFPDAPDVLSPEYASDISLSQLIHWQSAPQNPEQLTKFGCSFAFTAHGLKDVTQFLPQIRKTISKNFSKMQVLQSLTTIPAEICGIDSIAGTLESGKMANFIVCNNDIFENDAQIYEVWVSGKPYIVSPRPPKDIRGKWQLTINNNKLSLDIKGSEKSLQAEFIEIPENKVKHLTFANDKFVFVYQTKEGIQRLSGSLWQNRLEGNGILHDGTEIVWNAEKLEKFLDKSEEKSENKSEEKSEDKNTEALTFLRWFPNGPFGYQELPKQHPVVIIKNATIWTCAQDGILKNADILIHAGKIEKIGNNLPIPENAFVVDGVNTHITPGIIDEHSHIAINGGVNEATEAVTAEVRIGDVIDANSVDIYRQLAGGVTTTHLLHGSANPIGGQCQVIKLRWGSLPEAMKFAQAPGTIKFALGENVKQSNWGDKYTSRYPQTRMGVQEIIRDTFQAAKEYQAEWQRYQKLTPEEQRVTIPTRRDLELDAIVEVLESKRFVHCHSYVQSEILALAKLANEYGFHIGTFTHVLEGYKVAREMKKYGAMASAFSDWWAYKFEVYDAIPYNGALLFQEGVVTSFNSDDAEMARRLNQEAAKAIKYGNIPEEEAMKFVTLNAAKQLYVDKYVGSLEVGKDADFVVWNGHPLSNYSKVLQTWIEGTKYFDIENDVHLREQIKKRRVSLVQKILQLKYKNNIKLSKPTQEIPEHYHCDDIIDAMKGAE